MIRPMVQDAAKPWKHIYASGDMLLCMRTTIDIADELMRSAKKRAADENATLRTVVERALRQYLAGPQPQRPFKLKLKPLPQGSLLPGVVLEDRDSLYELMDGRR